MGSQAKPRIKVKNGQPLETKALAYEAATSGRRGGSNWLAPTVGPNAALNSELQTIRARSRAAYRNNPWIKQAIDRQVSNEVGCGIVPMFDSSNADFNAELERLWERWVYESSPDRALDFYGQLAQAVRTRRIAGEVLIRVRYKSAAMGMSVPLQLEIIEPDLLPLTYNETLKNGNRIIAGKEYTKRGQLAAFWLYTSHPNDNTGGAVDNSKLVRVPARDVIHHYKPTRPGQVRGEPDATAALLRAKTYDTYEDSELVRKQTRAPFTGFLKKDYQGDTDWAYDPITGEELSDDQVPEISAQPGTIITGAIGESLELFKGDDAGNGYSDYQRQQLLAISAGLGVPYELLTGDWSKINDRLYRALIGEYRRQIEADQDHLAIYQICERVGRWFTDQAVLSGAIAAPGYAENRADYNRREWRPHRFPYINPLQDVQATVAEIDADLESLDAAVAKRGYRASDIQRQNVDAQKRKSELLADAGLTNQTDEG